MITVRRLVVGKHTSVKPAVRKTHEAGGEKSREDKKKKGQEYRVKLKRSRTRLGGR